MRFLAEPVTVMTSFRLRSRIPCPITTDPIAIAIARMVRPTRSGTRANTGPTVARPSAESVKEWLVRGLIGDFGGRDDEPLAAAQPWRRHEHRDARADHSRHSAYCKRDCEAGDRRDAVRTS